MSEKLSERVANATFDGYVHLGGFNLADEIAALESLLDAANARVAELESHIWDNAKRFTEVYAENIALKRQIGESS